MILCFQMTEQVLDFPFVADLPKREQSRYERLWSVFESIRRVSRDKGVLIPKTFAGELAGVSPQRIGQLVEVGVLEEVKMGRIGYVTEDSFIRWASSERKNGRPMKIENMSIIDKAKFVLEVGQQHVREMVEAGAIQVSTQVEKKLQKKS